jgi:pSer/pThr/pTyr-binding forkhead associated (FHA) protein
MTEAPGWLLLALRLGLLLALYAFLAWSLLLIWREFKSQAQPRSAPAPTLILTKVDQSSTPRFNRSPVTIGRSPACECHLPDETVSTQHARLYYQNSQWWIEDLDSRNGTYLNDSPVAIPTVLAPGDELRCGDVEFRIDFDPS